MRRTRNDVKYAVNVVVLSSILLTLSIFTESLAANSESPLVGCAELIVPFDMMRKPKVPDSFFSKSVVPKLFRSNAYAELPPALHFKVQSESAKYVIRYQAINSPEELEFLLNTGVISRLRANSTSEFTVKLENEIAENASNIVEVAHVQKTGSTSEKRGHFLAPFIEASKSRLFIKSKLSSESSPYNLGGMAFMRIRAGRGMPARQFSAQFGTEAGVYFFGIVPARDVEAFIYLRNSDSQTRQFFSYEQSSEGRWISQAISKSEAEKFITDTLVDDIPKGLKKTGGSDF